MLLVILTDLKELHERVHPKAWQWFHSLEAELQSEILRAFGQMPELEEDWPSLPDGPAWTWWLLAFLPLSQELKVGMLPCNFRYTDCRKSILTSLFYSFSTLSSAVLCCLSLFAYFFFPCFFCSFFYVLPCPSQSECPPGRNGFVKLTCRRQLLSFFIARSTLSSVFWYNCNILIMGQLGISISLLEGTHCNICSVK